MKKTLEEISDLSNIKVGDKLFSTIFGEVIVNNIYGDLWEYPIEIYTSDDELIYFTKNGKKHITNPLQTLFLSNPFDLITNNNSGEKMFGVA